MSIDLQTNSIESFLDSLAAKTSTPGGGAVAAITGAQGCALISMVCQFSTNFEDATQMDNRAQQARASFLNLAQADIEAFNMVMAAQAQPKDEIGREQNIQSSLLQAAEAPRAMMVLANSLIDDTLTLLQRGNRNLSTDTGMAAILIETTIRSAELNILVNLKSISDESYRTEVTSEILACKSRLKELRQVADQIRQSLQAD